MNDKQGNAGSDANEQEQLQKEVDSLLVLIHDQAAQNTEMVAHLLPGARRFGPRGAVETLVSTEGLLRGVCLGARQLRAVVAGRREGPPIL